MLVAKRYVKEEVFVSFKIYFKKIWKKISLCQKIIESNQFLQLWNF